MTSFDVAVVGGGPAGSAAAIVLASSGARVMVVERSTYDGVRVGETLPPDVRVPLERLGVWDRFVDGGHQESPGIVAAWGAPEPYANDFLLNPYGCGWRLDRNHFDGMLVSAARDAGARVVTGTTVREAPPAPFVVDATGRRSSLCRSLGARHTIHDRLVALVGVVTPGAPLLDERALIEATEDGWWYSTGLPDSRVVMAFHTDPRPYEPDGWRRYLDAAPHTKGRAGGAAADNVRVVSANSHRLHPLAGDRWLAVGDAATAHDPLSGLGIHWALESGIAGAEAILAALDGDRSAVPAYARARAAHFDRYLAARTMYYRAENRWPHAAFWRRRHQRVVARGRDPEEVPH